MTSSQEDSTPSLEELAARLNSLVADNQADAASISQMGAQIDPASLNRMRLDTFVTFIFQRMGTPTPEIRQALSLMFEIEFQENVSEAMRRIKSEVRKAAMATPAMSSADLKKMWQEQQRNGNGPGLIK